MPIYLALRAPTLAATVPLWLAGTAGVVAGTFLGVPLLSRIPPAAYRRVVGGLLVLLGVTLALAVA